MTTFSNALRLGSICIALLAIGCRVESTSGQDAPAVAALRDSLQVAENAGSADRMAATFADDVIIMPPNASDVTGRAAAREFFHAEFQSVTMDVQYKSVETVVSGDWAFDRGTVTFRATPKAGGVPSVGRARYLWLLRRDSNDAWKYSRVTWNSDTTAK